MEERSKIIRQNLYFADLDPERFETTFAPRTPEGALDRYLNLKQGGLAFPVKTDDLRMDYLSHHDHLGRLILTMFEETSYGELAHSLEYFRGEPYLVAVSDNQPCRITEELKNESIALAKAKKVCLRKMELGKEKGYNPIHPVKAIRSVRLQTEKDGEKFLRCSFLVREPSLAEMLVLDSLREEEKGYTFY